MDIFYLLLRDHARQRRLMARILHPAQGNLERLELVEQLRAELMAHAAAEEQTLYAELLAVERERIQQSVDGSDEVAELLFQLQDFEIASSQWRARFMTLKTKVESHLELEEGELFARARRLITLPRTKCLGKRFEQAKRRELALDGGYSLRPIARKFSATSPFTRRRLRSRRTSRSLAGSRSLRRRGLSGGLVPTKGR